jgi:hypothetical protein
MARFKKRLHKIPTISRFCILNALFLASMSCYTRAFANLTKALRIEGVPTSKCSALDRLTAGITQ